LRTGYKLIQSAIEQELDREGQVIRPQRIRTIWEIAAKIQDWFRALACSGHGQMAEGELRK